MNRRSFNLTLAPLVAALAAVPVGAETRWQTLAPEGKGFSVEVPGDGQRTEQPGSYTYNAGLGGPKGLPHPSVERFFGSFRLVRTADASSAPTARQPPSTRDPAVTALAAPMLEVARLIALQRFDPVIDRLVQDAPGAERLAGRWTPSSAAWQQARSAITMRMARLTDQYGQSGDIVEALESTLAGLPPSDARTLRSAVTGADGPAIVRAIASIVFLSEVMADPSEPAFGDPRWSARTAALRRVFDERVGAAMPADAARADAAERRQADGVSEVLLSVCHSAVGRATNRLVGAINLMIFDEREGIMRDFSAAIASVK